MKLSSKKTHFSDGASPVITALVLIGIGAIIGASVSFYMLDTGENINQNDTEPSDETDETDDNSDKNPSASLSFDQDFNPEAADIDGDRSPNGYKVEAQLTSAKNIDFISVELGSRVTASKASISSTDGTDYNGDRFSGNDMSSVGQVITVSGLDVGDKFSVIGHLDGQEQVLNRYQVRQR